MSGQDAADQGAGQGRGQSATSADGAPTPPIFRPPPPPVAPVRTEAPSPEVAPVAAESGMPGEHRGGFSRLPTAPVGIAQPVDPVDAPRVEWAPPPAASHRGLSGWALVFAIAGLAFSLFVGWGFPIGIAAIVLAIIALRHPAESRGVAAWAICLAGVSVLYSAGWLLWAASRATLLG